MTQELPKGTTYGHVESMTLSVCTMSDYDVNYLQDRLIVTVRVDGGAIGYSAIHVPSELLRNQQDFDDLVEDHGIEMRRKAIDAALDLGYEAELRVRERGIKSARDEIRRLRRTRREKIRDWWAAR